MVCIDMDFNAFVVAQNESGAFSGQVKSQSTTDLPEGDVLIKVKASSLNFKDALSFSGNKGVTRHFPHTPGIDAVGVIVSSDSSEFSEGQDVLVIGYDLGMNTSGGFGEYIRVPSNWVMPLPENMNANQSMSWGTAGFTSALCVDKLIAAGVTKEQGPILISGATGGVGSIAIMLLSKLGFEVHALTGKVADSEFLHSLGASKVISREEFILQAARPMLKPLYAGAIDVAGGDVLATILKTINYAGSVACCGLVASVELQTTVLPFILRGVNLLGVDSVELPLNKKKEMWLKMSNEWSLPNLLEQCQIIGKEELSHALQSILDGKVKGRFVLDHSL